MSALQTPAADAPAAEWGRFATQIPDWRWPWTCSVLLSFCPSLPGYVWLDGAWCYTDDISPAARWSRIPAIPDPDHWAWEGWLRRMLGTEQDGVFLVPNDEGLVEWHNGHDWDAQSLPMGRACIAAAAALGRWPGGGE